MGYWPESGAPTLWLTGVFLLGFRLNPCLPMIQLAQDNSAGALVGQLAHGYTFGDRQNEQWGRQQQLGRTTTTTGGRDEMG